MTTWSDISDDAYEVALPLARGCYQRNLLRGIESLSGSTLKGKAKRYSGRYAVSRANLLDRLRGAGLEIGERRGEHGARILVVRAAGAASGAGDCGAACGAGGAGGAADGAAHV